MRKTEPHVFIREAEVLLFTVGSLTPVLRRSPGTTRSHTRARAHNHARTHAEQQGSGAGSDRQGRRSERSRWAPPAPPAPPPPACR